MRKQYNIPVTILLTIGIIICILLPLYKAFMISIKSPDQLDNVLALPTSLHFENYVNAFIETDYLRKFFNTLFITAINLIFTLLIHSFVAYAIVRCREKSKIFKIVYYIFVSAMFIPFSVIMLPLVIQADTFNLDNLGGITFLYIVLGLPMNTFLYSSAIKTTPKALEEAAKIDGASVLRTFYQIVFPILKPTTATVAILSFMWTWNDFQMPLVLLSDEKDHTLQLAQYVFKSQFSVDYNLAFASYLMVLIPIIIVYIFAQKFIRDGVVAGAVK